MGSPTPGFKAIRLSLPQGSSYLGIELHGSRTPRPVEDGSSWHFARGILVLNSSFELVAYRIANSGSSPKRISVAAAGERIEQEAPGVDGPFIHQHSRLVSRLAPGVYYAIGFGVDGSPANPNEYWSADVRVQGAVSCVGVAIGETFDLDHSQADAEFQVYAPNLGIAEEASFSRTTTRQVTVGLLDCSVQFDLEPATEAECEASLPGGQTLSVEDGIVPVVSGPGTTTVSFEHRGVAPVVSYAGASFDVLS